MAVKNVITLGKIDRSVVVVRLLLFLLSILFSKLQPLNVHTKNTRNELARPVMGTIYTVELL